MHAVHQLNISCQLELLNHISSSVPRRFNNKYPAFTNTGSLASTFFTTKIIKVKDKKLQVFVSSTYTDLIEERQAAVEAILSSGHIPAGMELFSAGDESQMTVIKRWIDESDIYLLILGGRYGSIDKLSGKSYTQLEFEYALEKSKPLFAVVINESAIDKKVEIIGRKAIEQDNPKLLKEFRELVLQNLVKFWDDKKDIKIAIHETISEFSYRKELLGWVRGDNIINAGILAEEIARLTKENSELRTSLINYQSDSNSTYSSLTYSQVKSLLEKEDAQVPNSEMNLFDFLIANGKHLVEYTTLGNDFTKPLKALIKYRMVINPSPYRYKFSEDGHNFYLKSLALGV